MKKYVKSAKGSKQYYEVSYYAGQGFHRGCVVLAENEEQAKQYGLEKSKEEIKQTYTDLMNEALDEADVNLTVNSPSEYTVDMEKKLGNIVEI